MTDREDAARHEESFLGNLAGAQDEYDWLVENEAWSALGWDSFGNWWEGRVRPVMRALSMRPTREIAAKVVEQVRAEERALPPAQRRTQRELAAMVGVDRSGFANRDGSRSVPRENAPRPDLEAIPAPDLRAYVEADPGIQAVQYRQRFFDALDRFATVVDFDPDRVAQLAEPHEVELLMHRAASLTAFADKVSRARRGLRLIQGEAK